MVYVTQICWQHAISKPVWHTPLLCVRWKTPDDEHRNCPKHAEFYSKNKFEKLVHLVGFILRIYHDARSPECQIYQRSVAPFYMWNLPQHPYATRQVKLHVLNTPQFSTLNSVAALHFIACYLVQWSKGRCHFHTTLEQINYAGRFQKPLV